MESKQAFEEPLGDGDYDVILLGTGVNLCILACLLQLDGYRCLVLDENSYYGGESASLRASELATRASGDHDKQEVKARLATLGRDKEFCIDLAPKLLLSKGRLVKVLVKTETHEYLDFHRIAASYVYHNGKIHKAPASSVEAVKTPLVSMMQKNKLRDFIKRFLEVQPRSSELEEEKAETADMSTGELFRIAGLTQETQDFLGHALALFPDDRYKERPARETLAALRLYADSVNAYGQSPFIYPAYGIGTLAEAFSRRSALAGATYMLNTKVDKVVEEKAPSSLNNKPRVRVLSNGRVATTRLVIADPYYAGSVDNAKERLGKKTFLLRSVFILSRRPKCLPVDSSAQVILPQCATGRRNDIYATVFSQEQQVCPKGVFVCICSTVAEKSPACFSELDVVAKLMGEDGLIQRFNFTSESYLCPDISLDRRGLQNVFFTASADPTSHFESCIADVEGVLEAARERLEQAVQGD